MMSSYSKEGFNYSKIIILDYASSMMIIIRIYHKYKGFDYILLSYYYQII